MGYRRCEHIHSKGGAGYTPFSLNTLSSCAAALALVDRLPPFEHQDSSARTARSERTQPVPWLKPRRRCPNEKEVGEQAGHRAPLLALWDLKATATSKREYTHVFSRAEKPGA